MKKHSSLQARKGLSYASTNSTPGAGNKDGFRTEIHLLSFWRSEAGGKWKGGDRRERVGVWAYRRMGVWAYGRMGVWAYGRMGAQQKIHTRSQRSEKVTKVLKGFEYTRNWILPVSEPSRMSFVPFSDLRCPRVDLLHADTPTRRHADTFLPSALKNGPFRGLFLSFGINANGHRAVIEQINFHVFAENAPAHRLRSLDLELLAELFIASQGQLRTSCGNK